jgi:thiamine-monophosphate kinase
MAKITSVGEFHLHEWLEGFLPKDTNPLKNVGDDAVLVEIPEGFDIVVSTDRVPLNLSGYYAGKFAAIQNFSDVISKGAQPAGLLLGILLKRSTHIEYFKEVVRGAADTAAKYGGQLIGGDTKESTVNTIVGTAVGFVEKGKAVSRSGAKEGDIVAVTQKHGWKLGWRWAKHVLDYYEPFIDSTLTAAIQERYDSRLDIPYRETLASIGTGAVTSSMDITDGLGASLEIIGVHSRVSFLIDEDSALDCIDPELLPLVESLKLPPVKFVWSPGYDWENLLTLSPSLFDVARNKVREAGGELHPIGQVTSQQGQQSCIKVRRSNGTINTLRPFTSEVFKRHVRSSQPRYWKAHIDYL